MSSETAAPGQQPTVLENVRALHPEIRERAEEIEQARAVPRDLAEKLRSAGVFRRYVPRSHGGDELWPDEGLTVIEELARADASVAWVAAVGSEAARQGSPVRRVLTHGLKASFELLSRLMPGRSERVRRKQALATYASLVGGLILSRVVDDADLSAEILDAVTASVPSNE